MSSQLDPAILAAITAEARQCFLDEDAPEYLEMLSLGIENRAQPDYNALLRAAHSLKGGAGLANMTSLQQLAHKLEDVLVGLQQDKIEEIELAWALVENSIDEIGLLVSQAHNADEAIANPELIVALKSLMSEDSSAVESAISLGAGNQDLICSTLRGELENSFILIEELELDTEAELLEPLLSGFIDECIFISETLSLPWLGLAVTPINEALASDSVVALLLAKEIIAQLRIEIAEYLVSLDSQPDELAAQESINQSLVENALSKDLEELCQAIADLELDTPEAAINQAVAGFADECIFISETLSLPWLKEAMTPIEVLLVDGDPFEVLLTAQQLAVEILQQRDTYLKELDQSDRQNQPRNDLETGLEPESVLDENLSDKALSPVTSAPAAVSSPQTIDRVAEVPTTSNTQVRISLDKLEGMINNVEELILSQSRINRQYQVLNQANQRLRLLTRQFEPIREQIQDLYNQLAVVSPRFIGDNGEGDKNNFDSLEMDRYTDLHSSLQSFQELMLQIQEARVDIDLIDRELSENLADSDKNLDILYAKVTDSRLVPFDTLAKRFIPQIRGLSQRFDKPVDLKIEGKNTLIDQVILEQLQTPLTHLLNNAFDHGIEAKYDRLTAQKPETATITLSAKLQNNQLIITIKDDGGGINLHEVFRRAVERGICPPDKTVEDFRPEEIINWIFEPDFSTAAKVSDISGRGMGLDIVQNLINQLRGQLRVATSTGFGSTFTINLPLTLSLQSLMLVQLQNRLIAIPHSSILEILPHRELRFADAQKQYINWQNKTIPLVSVSGLFPCPRQPLQTTQAKVGIVLQTAAKPLAILVDAIAGEDKLIIKSFDETVPLPSYIAGCTILGTGEVIPVVLPQGLAKEAVASVALKDTTSTVAQTTPTILVAEDSVATRRMLEKVLLAVGYQVVVCRDGQEALDRLEQYQERIDLILSDVEMPRINGFELLEKARAQPIFKNTPIVMATSRTGERHRQQAQDLGATDYLSKPVQPQQLIDTIASLLAR